MATTDVSVAGKRESTVAPQDAPVRLIDCVARPVHTRRKAEYRGLLLFPAGAATAYFGAVPMNNDPLLSLLWLAVAIYAFVSAVQLLARNH